VEFEDQGRRPQIAGKEEELKIFNVDTSTGLVSFSFNFCQFMTSKKESITNVFPNIGANYKNPVWLSERAILTEKNLIFFRFERNNCQPIAFV